MWALPTNALTPDTAKKCTLSRLSMGIKTWWRLLFLPNQEFSLNRPTGMNKIPPHFFYRIFPMPRRRNKISISLFTSVERFSVSSMRDFFVSLKNNFLSTLPSIWHSGGTTCCQEGDPKCKCGLKKTSRIVGGKETKVGETYNIL